MLDLHTHSTVSDGSDPPERIVELAAEAGCTAVALTDHDRLDGVGVAADRAAALSIGFVSGCELSCEFPGTMHVLVYWLEQGDGPLQDELGRLQRGRQLRNERLVARLNDNGVPITYEEIAAEAKGDGIGRPHVAAVLVRKGIVGSIQEAFDVWLAKGQPGYVDRERLSPGDALSLAKASGAVPVLAHPLSLGLEGDELVKVVGELAELGLAGVEAIYGRYSPDERELIAALGRQFDLVITGGSDYHGSYKPDLQIGTGRGDLDVADDTIDRLATRKP